MKLPELKHKAGPEQLRVKASLSSQVIPRRHTPYGTRIPMQYQDTHAVPGYQPMWYQDTSPYGTRIPMQYQDTHVVPGYQPMW